MSTTLDRQARNIQNVSKIRMSSQSLDEYCKTVMTTAQFIQSAEGRRHALSMMMDTDPKDSHEKHVYDTTDPDALEIAQLVDWFDDMRASAEPLAEIVGKAFFGVKGNRIQDVWGSIESKTRFYGTVSSFLRLFVHSCDEQTFDARRMFAMY